MKKSKNLLFWIFFVCLVCFYSLALSKPFKIPRAFNRINIRCPVEIETNQPNHQVRLKKASFSKAIRLYEIVDKRLKSAKKSNNVYKFDIKNKELFVVYAKSNFRAGELSLQLKQQSAKRVKPLRFLNVFFVQTIDFNSNIITMIRRYDRKEYTITIPDFEEAFLWYSDMLDSERVYIPVYGFLSIPKGTEEAVNVYTTWKEETPAFRQATDNELQYDFYKILDHKNGYYLIGNSLAQYDVEGNKEDWGITGWVKEKFIVLWRSRYYFHPLDEVTYYNDNSNQVSKNLDKYEFSNRINQFYVKQDFPILLPRIETHSHGSERIYSQLRPFYMHFGFPQLYPPHTLLDFPYTRVCILNPFTRQVVDRIIKDVKSNMYIYFLIDSSKSMIPFKGFIKSFNKEISQYRHDNFGVNKKNYYAFNDSRTNDIFFKQIYDIDDIEFGNEVNDIDYKEPLISSMEKTITCIKEQIGPNEHYVKILFIITDAGPNDYNSEKISNIKKTFSDLGVVIYFIIPDGPLITGQSPTMDSPSKAYLSLKKMVTHDFLQRQQYNYYKQIIFKSNPLSDDSTREDFFTDYSKNIAKEITSTINKQFKSDSNEIDNNHFLLQFVSLKLLKLIKQWKKNAEADPQIQGHIVKYIDFISHPDKWDGRIAIPYEIINTFKKAIINGETGNIELLKKIFIVNSLISITSVNECIDIYDQLNEYIFEEKDEQLDYLLSLALIDNTYKVRSNIKDISIQKITTFINTRSFFLNKNNKMKGMKFIYLKKEELFE